MGQRPCAGVHARPGLKRQGMVREKMNLLAALASYRASVKGRDPLETTQIEFINLGPLRERYGERWPRVRERIFDVCQAFIERRIGRGDLVMRAATGFMVLPGPDRIETASVFTERIQSELQTFFLGVEDFEGLGVSASVASLPASSLFSAMESPAMAAAAAAHEAAGAAPADPAAARAPGGVQAAEPLRLPPFRLTYEPVWTAASQFVALHKVTPEARMTAAGRALQRGHDLAPSEGGPAMRMELDRRVLISAAVAWCAQQGSPRAALSVPVHYETLALLKCRLPYLAAFSTLSSGARGGLMLFVRAAPWDAPYTRLTEVCRSAKALFRRLVVEIDPERVQLDRFVDARVDVFTFTAPPVFTPRISDAVRRLSTGAARLDARCAMGGCAEMSQLTTALECGVHHISGPAVGAAARTIQTPYPLDLTAAHPPAAYPSNLRQTS